MKILITTVFFPPQNAIASQRPYSWALAWSRAGHEVTVLTIEKDRERADLAPMEMHGFRTIEVPAGTLIGRLRELWKRKRQEKLKKNPSFLMAIQPNDILSSPTRSSRTGDRSKLRAWLRRRGFMSSVRWPDIFDFWVPPAIAKIPVEKFDLIISTFGPPASLAVGYRAKFLNPQAKWICDFRDLWTDNHVFPGFWLVSFFERIVERRYLEKADLITTVSSALALSLRAKVKQPEKVEVFENGFQPGELESLVPGSVFQSDTKKHLVYTGSLHPTQRNPRPLFEAAARLSANDRKDFEIVFVGPREAFIDDLVSEFKLQDIVRSTGSLPRKESLRYQRDADVLLFFEMQREAAKDGVLTGKLFEYLASGRPVWAIGIDSTSTVGTVLETNSCGRAFGDDVEKIECELRKILTEGRVPDRDTSRPEDIVRKYDRNILAARMLDWIVRS